MKVGSMPQSLLICRNPDSLSISKSQTLSHESTGDLGLERSSVDAASSQLFASGLEEIRVEQSNTLIEGETDKLQA